MIMSWALIRKVQRGFGLGLGFLFNIRFHKQDCDTYERLQWLWTYAAVRTTFNDLLCHSNLCVGSLMYNGLVDFATLQNNCFLAYIFLFLCMHQ